MKFQEDAGEAGDAGDHMLLFICLFVKDRKTLYGNLESFEITEAVEMC